MFDLAEADLRVTLDLLARLAGFEEQRVFELVSELRAARLVQPKVLGLTMLGLSVALVQPEFEPASSQRPAKPRHLRAA